MIFSMSRATIFLQFIIQAVDFVNHHGICFQLSSSLGAQAEYDKTQCLGFSIIMDPVYHRPYQSPVIFG